MISKPVSKPNRVVIDANLLMSRRYATFVLTLAKEKEFEIVLTDKILEESRLAHVKYLKKIIYNNRSENIKYQNLSDTDFKKLVEQKTKEANAFYRNIKDPVRSFGKNILPESEYKHLEDPAMSSDPGDVHVVAAAVASKASYIATHNGQTFSGITDCEWY
ncbi:MAG: PIN domain-containing protein [Micrococcaceae bacterium]